MSHKLFEQKENRGFYSSVFWLLCFSLQLEKYLLQALSGNVPAGLQSQERDYVLHVRCGLSKEYSKCIEKYLTPQDRYITIVFCELSGDKLVTKGTYAKMARGEMVRFMAENSIENPEDIKKFDRLGYSFRSDLSSDAEYVFERKKE